MNQFGRDKTGRWSCRDGDFVIWGRSKGPFSNPNEAFQVGDVWKLRDGDFITITNRLADLPPWFELHPLEAAGRIADQVLKELDRKRKPSEPVEGPNLWRACTGDRLVWFRAPPHGDQNSDGLLELLEFGADALIYGETTRPESKLELFGAFDASEETQEAIQLAKSAWAALSAKSLPRSLSDGCWRLG